jgi:hypothetical protein
LKEEKFFGDSPKVTGAVIGLVVGVFLLFWAGAAAFGLCSDTTLFEVFFPFATVVDHTLFNRTLLALGVALLQYPLYGFIAGVAYDYVSKWKDVDRFIKTIASVLPSGFLHLFVFAMAKLFWSK